MSDIKVGDKVKVEFEGVIDIVDADASGFPFRVLVANSNFATWLNDSHITKIEPEKPEQKFKIGQDVIVCGALGSFVGKISGFCDRTDSIYIAYISVHDNNRFMYNTTSVSSQYVEPLEFKQKEQKEKEPEPESKFKAGDLVIVYNCSISPIIGRVAGFHPDKVRVKYLENPDWSVAAHEDNIDHLKFREEK